MARYTGPKCKLCRREGVQLFLKGARCESPKCAVVRRQVPPGQHGLSRKQLSGYGVQLREKQKTKRVYGVLEKQFRVYFEEAERQGGEAGVQLLQLLERRLDNVIYRLHLAHSRANARQLIRQGKFLVNGHEVNIPSIRVNLEDSITLADKRILRMEGPEVSWLTFDEKKNKAAVSALPERSEIKEQIEEQLVVEYYSR